MKEFNHIPVLFNETIESLNIRPDGIYVDGTAGGGSHSKAIAQKLETGRLICIDQDPDAIEVLKERLGSMPQVTIVRSNFSQIANVLDDLGIDGVDGVLFDIGVSSYQFDTAERGFSYRKEAPLDMRMSQEGTTAAELVNTLDVYALADIFRIYGEEKFAMKIARAIDSVRQKTPIETTTQLAEIISGVVPAAYRRDGHPARKVFQALRVVVNKELDVLEQGMDGAFEKLNRDGRLAVISFQSMEARIVKHKMAQWCKGCTCPPEFPVCVCGNKPRARMLTRKPIEPSEEELERNPRSRSSSLRVCIKL